MPIIPNPNCAIIYKTDGHVVIGSNLSVVFDNFSRNCVQAFFERTGCAFDNTTTKPCLKLRRNESFSLEEYDISIDADRVEVTASCENGIILALTTLYQLIDEYGRINGCHIHEKPRYSHRGLSLDCVRHFFRIAEVKRIVEQMALVKMNVLHWHLTNDQGWRIESKRYPKLTRQHGNDFYSHDEIKELIDYAAVRGVEVIPEIEMPGHSTGLLAAYPEYSCSGQERKLAGYGGIYPIILCGGNEHTYELISNLLDEICPLFPSTRLHIGGDEAPKKEWRNCPCCQQKIKENGLKNEVELQGYFSNRISRMLDKHGKTAICWNDSLEAANLHSDIIAQFWSVQYASSLKPFVRKGGKFYYSDMFSCYLDYPHAMSPLKRVYAETPVIEDTDYSDSTALLGIEACLWAEHIKTESRLEEQLFPRLYAIAETAWSIERDYNDFTERLTDFVKKYHPADMNITPDEGWDPQGQVRQQEAFEYMKTVSSSIPEEVYADTMEAAAPNPLFQKKFMTCFFEPEDAPLLMKMKEG